MSSIINAMDKKAGGMALLVLWSFVLGVRPAQADECDFSQRGTDQICTLTWNNLLRQYLLHVPSNFAPGQSAIVLGFHGTQGSGPTFSGSSLTVKGEQVGFAVAYPSATNPPGNTGIWQIDGVNSDDGSTWLWTERGATPPDDLGFIRQLIATLQAGLGPDPNKIYATGFSEGGEMAHRVGIDLSDVVAAIGVVSGLLPSADVSGLANSKAPVSVIVLHGTLDAFSLCGFTNPAPHSSARPRIRSSVIGPAHRGFTASRQPQAPSALASAGL